MYYMYKVVHFSHILVQYYSTWHPTDWTRYR